MSKWISVKDRLPENEHRVLVFANDIVSEFCEVVGWNGGDFLAIGFGHNIIYPPMVTHWMPLPEPPEDKS